MPEWFISCHNDAVNYLEDCLRVSKMKGLSCKTFEANSFVPTSSCKSSGQAAGDVAQGCPCPTVVTGQEQETQGDGMSFGQAELTVPLQLVWYFGL